jgi:hypothetical protein
LATVLRLTLHGGQKKSRLHPLSPYLSAIQEKGEGDEGGGKIKVIYCYLEPVISLNVKREK